MMLSEKENGDLIELIHKGMDHYHPDRSGPSYTCIYCHKGRCSNPPPTDRCGLPLPGYNDYPIRHQQDCEGIRILKILLADISSYKMEE